MHESRSPASCRGPTSSRSGASCHPARAGCCSRRPTASAPASCSSSTSSRTPMDRGRRSAVVELSDHSTTSTVNASCCSTPLRSADVHLRPGSTRDTDSREPIADCLARAVIRRESRATACGAHTLDAYCIGPKALHDPLATHTQPTLPPATGALFHAMSPA
jgi:hypothetical protein